MKTLEPALSLKSKFKDQYAVSLSWSPDGAKVAAMAPTGEMRVWNSATGELLMTIKEEHPGSTRFVWFPDSARVGITTATPRGVRIWNLDAGKPVGDILPQNGGNVWGLRLAANGQKLAMQRHGWTSLFNLSILSTRTAVWETNSSPVAESAAWSPDGRELAVTGDKMAVWSSGTRRGLTMLPMDEYHAAEWLPDGDGIMHHGRIERRAGAHWNWDVNSRPIQIGPTTFDIQGLSPDGKRLAFVGAEASDSTGKRRVEISDVATANRRVQTEPLGKYIKAFAWSPDGALLAAGIDDDKASIYDAATGTRLAELPAARAWIRPLAFSPDGKTLAVGYGGRGNGFVRLYDAETLRKASGVGRQASGAEDGKPVSDATHPHPSPLPEGEGARADADGNPKSQIENPKSDGLPEQKADGAATPRNGTESVPYRELPCNGGPQEPEIVALHWSADGRRLKVLDRAAVYVFDTATGERLAEAPRLDRTPHHQRPANFSPDGRFLAVATTCTRV